MRLSERAWIRVRDITKNDNTIPKIVHKRASLNSREKGKKMESKIKRGKRRKNFFDKTLFLFLYPLSEKFF